MTRWGDERGQSIQVGAIILFGFLVLALSGYQAVAVPNQNAQVEFQHSQVIAQDVQQFRNDLLEAAANGRRFSAEFDLGTDYPPRIFGLNPPPATGTLRTVTFGSGGFSLVASNASLEDICGYDRDGDGAVPSKALVYEPSYNVYQQGPTVVYENTVVYRRYERDDVVLFDSNQTLIQGDRILIPPLIGNVSASSSMTYTVDVFPGKAGVGGTVGQNITLVVPTNLTVEQWEKLLSDEFTSNGGHVVAVRANGSDVEIELEAAEYQITCPVIGTGDVPNNDPEQLRGSDSGINPGGPGDVRLSDIEVDSEDTDNARIILSFTNPGDDVNINDARFLFYQAKQTPPAQLDLFKYDRANTTAGEQFINNLLLRGAAKSPDQNVTFTGGNNVTSILVEFEDNEGNPYSISQKDFIIINLKFSDGQVANYFINIP